MAWLCEELWRFYCICPGKIKAPVLGLMPLAFPATRGQCDGEKHQRLRLLAAKLPGGEVGPLERGHDPQHSYKHKQGSC